MNAIRVLHTFESYLSDTENWAFNLINHTPDIEIVIASQQFLKSNFYSNRFEYLQFPLTICSYSKRPAWLWAVNKITAKLLALYPWYIGKILGSCDLIHSHFAMMGWQYMKTATKLKIPHVVSFYGLDYQYVPFQDPVWVKRYRQLFENADLFLSEGNNGAEILKEIGCPSEKIKVARLGVDVDRIPFWSRKKCPQQLNLLQVATFTEKKGHQYTIEAFISALKNCPDMTLTLVGGDKNNLKSKLLSKIKNTAAEEKIYFLNNIDFKEIYKFIKNYHIFIHPSCHTEQMDCEGGAPIVLLDAQATGMPVISTTHCDIPDEVVDGKTGLLSPEKDSSHLAKSIQIFYEMKQEEYNLYSENARKHVEENYDVRLNASKVRDIYNQLLFSTKNIQN